MLKPEQIPDEAVDAAVAMRDRGGSMKDIIRTAINAWPGMYKPEIDPQFPFATSRTAPVTTVSMPCVILPLHPEKETSA